MTDTLVQGLASLLGGKSIRRSDHLYHLHDPDSGTARRTARCISRPLECSDPASHSHLRDWKPAPDSIHPAAH